MLSKPTKTNYPEYFALYISLAPSDNILKSLTNQLHNTTEFYSDIDIDLLNYRYQKSKWSILEILGHCIDVERIFAYRALRFSRNDQTDIPSFDDNSFVAESQYDKLILDDLLTEYLYLRKSNLQMFKNFKDVAWNNFGSSNSQKMITSAIPFIIYGHQQHHENVIRERYLK